MFYTSQMEFPMKDVDRLVPEVTDNIQEQVNLPKTFNRTQLSLIPSLLILAIEKISDIGHHKNTLFRTNFNPSFE